MKHALLYLGFLALGLNSCQSDPWGFQYARTKPNQSIAGIYKPTAQTYTLLQSMYKNVKASQLELRNDSSFIIKDVAAVWSPFSVADGFETVSGRWSLIMHQDWWAIQLTVQSTREPNGHINHNIFTTPVMLIGQQVPYKLHFGIGDPDSGEALQYELQ